MDIDENTADTEQPKTTKQDAATEAEADPMQADDSVHTPALPSDAPEVPAASSGGSALDIVKADEEPPQDATESTAQVKAEPQTESYEEPTSVAAEDPETIPSAPAVEEQAQAEAPVNAEDSGTAQISAEAQAPVEVSGRSTELPAAVENRSPLHVQPEEVRQQAPSVRDPSPVTRITDIETAQPRSSARVTPAPGPVHERRLERTQERSRTAERSQDREQRAREKDRRREMERLEREHERERERIRESERDREMMIARENEEARLIWLSLPGNDHPQYYTDTDSDSCYGAEGALGVQVTDEEDKDLDPPLPISLQEYHPAPSYSQSYFDHIVLHLEAQAS